MASINASIRWENLLRHFECRPFANSLPTKAKCPVCRSGQLQVVHDACQDGGWSHCAACGFTGDMLHLAATMFKLGDEAAVRQLEYLGILPNTTNTSLKLEQRRRRLTVPFVRANDLLQESLRGGRAVIASGALSLSGQLRLNNEHSLSWAADGPGKCIGFLDTDRAEALCRKTDPNSPNVTTRAIKRQVCPGLSNGVFVLPFYDAPNRVSSVSFIGAGNARSWAESIWTPAYATPAGPYAEGGVSYHPDALTKQGAILLTDSVELGVRFWFRWYTRSPQPVPLAIYRSNDAPTSVWQPVAPCHPILWATELTASLLSRSIKTGFRISISGPRLATMGHYLSTTEPDRIVETAIHKAKEWPEIILRLAEHKSGEELADLFAQLELSAEERYQVANSATPELSKKVKSALGMTIAYKTVTDAHGCMVQRPTGWYYQKQNRNEELIVNAPFKILSAIHQDNANGGSSVVYEIEVCFNNQKLVFFVNKDEFSKKPLETLQHLLIEKGIGVIAINKRFNAKVMAFALQLHQPAVLKGVTAVGYSPAEHKLVTPQSIFDLRTGASARATPIHSRLPLSGPEYTAEINKELSDELNKLSKPHWAVYLAILRQILAPAAGLAAQNVLLKDLSSDLAAVDIVDALNLPKTTGTSALAIMASGREHNVPKYITASNAISQQTRSTLFRSPGQGHIFTANLEQHLYGLLSGTGVLITSNNQNAVRLQLKYLATFTSLIISTTIKHSLLPQLIKNDAGLLTILRRTVKEYGLEISVGPSLFTDTRFPGNIAIDLADVVARLIGIGRFRRMVASDPKLQPNCVYRLAKQHVVFVPKKDLANTLVSAGAPSLDLSEISERLLDSQPTVKLDVIKNVEGWLLPADLLDESIQRLTSSISPAVKAVKAAN